MGKGWEELDGEGTDDLAGGGGGGGWEELGGEGTGEVAGWGKVGKSWVGKEQVKWPGRERLGRVGWGRDG